ncbi:hypothetical protein HDU96_004633 [Phlyctochytrium bullatum]|nr:hypothetical protein HDU96_004633 [Phlyctochytrium bullatum]
MAAEDASGETQTEWEKYWSLVSSNPDDFASWEALIRVAETANGGINKDSSTDDMNNLRLVYDHFLAKFPLCFGYWKKYADWENTLEGEDKAESVYERGVTSIHNSVDLWTHYASFKVTTGEEDTIRGVFERGATAVGYDFLSHTFWDKYIEFEESKQQEDRVMAILERVIRIPLHQYARYFEKYSQLSVTRPVAELMAPEELEKLEDEVRRESQGRTEEEIQNDLRQKIHGVKSEIYMQNQDAVHKRWVFEAEIKRSYFHIKPLDENQLANWRRYLEFEENEGDIARVYILYERCLVACALYEEFWLRYVRFLIRQGDLDGARNVFIRATTVFVPQGRTGVRLEYAEFEEENGKVDAAREIYQKLLEAVPGHVETLYKFAHFERRQTSFEKGDEILSDGIEKATDDKAKAFLVVTRAKYFYNLKGDIEETRRIYSENITSLADHKYLLLNYFLFESNQPGLEAIANSKNVWEAIKVASCFSNNEKRELGYRLVDMLLERLGDITSAKQLEREILKDYPTESAAAAVAPPAAAAATGADGSASSTVSASDSNKRRAGVDDSPYRTPKVAKLDHPASATASVPSATPTMAGMPHAGMPGMAPMMPAAPVNPYGAYPAAAAAAAAMWGQMGYYGQQGWDYSQAGYGQQ